MFNHSKGYGKAKFVYWGIRDEQLGGKKAIERIINEIKNRVEELVEELKSKS
jgi:hypothetical protein